MENLHKQGVFVCFIFQVVIVSHVAAQPSWQVPSGDETLDISAANACDKITDITALSTDSTTVSYSIVSQVPDGGFAIDINFATFVSSLKCDQAQITSSSYTVIIRATQDSGNSDITLTLVVPAQSPVFVIPDPDNTKPEHTIYIDETIQAGDVVLQLLATDGDTDDATLTFNMVASDVITKELFEIDGASLKVKISVAQDLFDIDKVGAVQQYPIDLEVSDGETFTNLSTVVAVRDINDNAPEFSGETSVTIPENTTGGQNVLTLTVIDKDKDSENNQVTLTLLEGFAIFILSGNDLNVAVGITFSYTDTPSYSVVVNANDQAPNDPKETNQTITININSSSGSGTDSNSGSEDNGWIYGVAIGCAVIAVVGAFVVYKVKMMKKVSQELIIKDPGDELSKC